MYNKGDSLALCAVEDDIPGGCVIAKILPQIPKKKNWQGPERNRSQSKQFFSLFNVNLAVIPLQFPNKWKDGYVLYTAAPCSSCYGSDGGCNAITIGIAGTEDPFWEEYNVTSYFW